MCSLPQQTNGRACSHTPVRNHCSTFTKYWTRNITLHCIRPMWMKWNTYINIFNLHQCIRFMKTWLLSVWFDRQKERRKTMCFQFIHYSGNKRSRWWHCIVSFSVLLFFCTVVGHFHIGYTVYILHKHYRWYNMFQTYAVFSFNLIIKWGKQAPLGLIKPRSVFHLIKWNIIHIINFSGWTVMHMEVFSSVSSVVCSVQRRRRDCLSTQMLYENSASVFISVRAQSALYCLYLSPGAEGGLLLVLMFRCDGLLYGGKCTKRPAFFLNFWWIQ